MSEEQKREPARRLQVASNGRGNLDRSQTAVAKLVVAGAGKATKASPRAKTGEPPHTTAKTARRAGPRVEVIRHGRDEMNLVEYPFASLWKNTEPGTEILHEWEATHPTSGKVLKAFWRVSGDAKLGLPTATDEQVYLVLMELTQDSGLHSQTVYFTRHNLLKRLGWIHNDKNYRLLEKAFTRLAAVSITSQNAFWNARARSFETVGFSLLDNFKILAEPAGRKRKAAKGQFSGGLQGELPLSYFKWNDVLFESFQAGYIRSIDVGFVLTLKSSIALRLYRYLDKKSYGGRSGFEIELAALCERHLGMRPSRYPSKYKERLKPAHDELITRGFLLDVTYEPMKTKRGEKACYAFAKRFSEAVPDSPSSSPWTQVKMEPVQPAFPLSPPNLTAVADEQVQGEDVLLARILALKVSPEVARGLLQVTSPEEIRLQLDCLQERQPRNLAATFVKAVREGWDAPQAYVDRREAQERALRSQESQHAQQRREAERKLSRDKAMALQEEETVQLDALWQKLDSQTQSRIDSEARQRLGVLGEGGRARGALVAMRRAILREELATEASADTAPV